MADSLLLRGQKLQIEFAIRSNGTMPAKDFYDNNLSDKERRKLRAPMELLAETMRVSNREHFKKIEGTEELFEFKSHQVRLIGFFLPGGRFVLAHGIRKKQDRLSARDIRLADEIRKEVSAQRA